MASVHSRLVDMLTQIGRRVVRLEAKWDVRLVGGTHVDVTDAQGGETGFDVERDETTITMKNGKQKFIFEVTPNEDGGFYSG